MFEDGIFTILYVPILNRVYLEQISSGNFSESLVFVGGVRMIGTRNPPLKLPTWTTRTRLYDIFFGWHLYHDSLVWTENTQKILSFKYLFGSVMRPYKF